MFIIPPIGVLTPLFVQGWQSRGTEEMWGEQCCLEMQLHLERLLVNNTPPAPFLIIACL